MRGKTKILTVSRDPVLVSFLQKELAGGDYEVIETRHTGLEVKGIIENERPDFLILDIMMPSLEGIGICLQLRQWTQAPVMMLTTWGTAGNTVRGLNLSAESYLTEPFNIEVLKRRIEETIERRAIAMAEMAYSVGSRRN